jgi:hypothetical protein
MSMTLYVQRVIGILYAGSHRILHNLTDIHWKPLACFGLCMDMVPMAYQWRVILLCAESHWLFCNLTDICQKPLACFGLCVGIVPKAYQWDIHDDAEVAH